MRNSIYNFLVLFLFVSMIQSCKVNSSELPEPSNQTVLVDLKDDIIPEQLEEEFKVYNLRNKKSISKPLNIFLFTFNQKKITAAELVEELRISQNVENAQTNKEVNNRN